MYKLCLALIFLIGGLSIISAQDKPVNPASTDFSESSSYEPRKLNDKKKEKLPKKNSDRDNKLSKGDSTVKIPVFVYDRDDKAVTDLTASDFKLFVGEKEQEITAFEIARAPLDLVLVVDTSPSTANNIDEIKNFVTKLAEALKPADKIQIITFNSKIKVLCEATNDKQIISKAVKKLDFGNGTSIYDSVDEIFRKVLNADSSQKTVVFLTDGVDTTSIDKNYAKSLFEAEKKFAAVFPLYLNTIQNIPNFKALPPAIMSQLPTVAIWGGRRPLSSTGTTEDEYELGLKYLQDIATLSGGRALYIKELANVKSETINEITEFLKPQYYISFKLPEPGTAVERKPLKVRVNRPNLAIQARGSLIVQ